MSQTNIFEESPVYQLWHFSSRKMDMQDAEDLFQCYRNPESAKYFNGDCYGGDFYSFTGHIPRCLQRGGSLYGF